MNKKLETMVEKIAKNLQIDPDLIKGIIMTESGGNSKAESSYARGLMQISRAALKTINFKYRLNNSYDDLFDPKINVEVGTLYLKWLLEYFKGKYPLNPFYIIYALMAYNWGVGNVQKWLRSNNASNSWIDENVPQETKSYLLDTIWWYAYFKNRHCPPPEDR
ncbi:lytic transglycosylase domain-containing protein [Thermosipho sp. 1074]|uniref:lytic transglycosylase domain-containing protein n=1 Tax=Thermosipho sp. 1074 TaxID=1643331 RepID=UPI0009859EA6|nr:lytic transglycosylase domain-containing protein [Thermosipho sp. 1074]